MIDIIAQRQLVDEPALASSWLMAGGAKYNESDWLGAARWLHRARVIDTSVEDAAFYHSAALVRLERHEAAIQALNEYLASHSATARVHVLIGRAYFEQKSMHHALSAFENARLAGDTSSVLATWIGQCHMQLVDSKQAAEAFKTAVTRDPSNMQAHVLLARQFFDLGDMALAREHSTAALGSERYGSIARGIISAIDRVGGGAELHRAAPWPRARSLFDDLRQLAKKFVLTGVDSSALTLSLETKVVTLGSCFAENLAIELIEAGIATNHIGFTEVLNSTYANLYFLDWLFEGGEAPEYYDAFAAYFPSLDKTLTRRAIKEADVFVYTLGVAPCLFEVATGRFVFRADRSEIDMQGLSTRYAFRTTSIDENVENLLKIRNVLVGLAPSSRIVYSVSPVPLNATFEYSSAIIADCVSKSVLRSAADVIARCDDKRLVYWPSFEIVRWLGAHTSTASYGDDGNTRHVNRDLVKLIVELFIEVFGTPELCLRAKISHEKNDDQRIGMD